MSRVPMLVLLYIPYPDAMPVTRALATGMGFTYQLVPEERSGVQLLYTLFTGQPKLAVMIGLSVAR